MESTYDAIAEWYDQSVRDGALIHDLVLPTVLDLAGDIKGRRICDLACGQGVVARRLAEQGALAVGVDVSARLLEIARDYECVQPLGITYRHDDAQKLSTCADAEFDGAVCNMALMDIPDVEAVLRAAYRVLRPFAWLVFSITHPCFQTPTSRWLDDADSAVSRAVRGYFVEGLWRSDNAAGVRGQVGSYHRTLSTYLNALVAGGFVVEHLAEPRATGAIASRLPGYMEVPAVLVARCRKR